MNEPVAASAVEPGALGGSRQGSGKMSPVEAVEQALAQVGAAPAEDLAAFIQQRYGVVVQPRFVPIIREMLKDKERRAEALRTRPSLEPDTASQDR